MHYNKVFYIFHAFYLPPSVESSDLVHPSLAAVYVSAVDSPSIRGCFPDCGPTTRGEEESQG